MLSAWQEQGYSVRHILTEALLRLDDTDSTPEFPVEEIVSALAQVSEQLKRLQQDGFRPGPISAQEASLEEAFLLSVKEAARPGLTLDD